MITIAIVCGAIGMVLCAVTLAYAAGVIGVRKRSAAEAVEEPVIQRTTEDGQFLTTYELSITSKGRCPDCDFGKLLVGPSGGCSVNSKCDNCGSKFNVFFGVTAERISNPCPDLFPSYPPPRL